MSAEQNKCKDCDHFQKEGAMAFCKRKHYAVRTIRKEVHPLYNACDHFVAKAIPIKMPLKAESLW